MAIHNKEEHDPVTDLYITDAYMRWALQAAEEVVGQRGMHVVLREAGLAHLIDNYPPNEASISGNFTFGNYADLCAALTNFFGRASKSMMLRIGRLSAQYAAEQQSAAFGLNTLVKASRLLPLTAQLKAGIAVMQTGFRKLNQRVDQELHLRIEDRGETLAYIDGTCYICAGKTADTHICWVRNGTLVQAAHWLTGKEFDIQEVECRAMGAAACIWEINKTPKST